MIPSVLLAISLFTFKDIPDNFHSNMADNSGHSKANYVTVTQRKINVADHEGVLITGSRFTDGVDFLQWSDGLSDG